MKIIIQIKSVYGRDTVYPICEKAKLFASIAGTTTLTHSTLCYVERLGYSIEVKLPTYNQQVLQRMQTS